MRKGCAQCEPNRNEFQNFICTKMVCNQVDNFLWKIITFSCRPHRTTIRAHLPACLHQIVRARYRVPTRSEQLSEHTRITIYFIFAVCTSEYTMRRCARRHHHQHRVSNGAKLCGATVTLPAIIKRKFKCEITNFVRAHSRRRRLLLCAASTRNTLEMRARSKVRTTFSPAATSHYFFARQFVWIDVRHPVVA